LKYIFYLTLIIVWGCSSYKGHNRVDRMDVRLIGGVYGHKKWDDSFVLKRTSFYDGARLLHDVLIAKLEKSSPFYAWLGKQKSIFVDCNEFYIALFYKDMNLFRGVPISYMRDQIIEAGFNEVSVQDFSYYLREHYAFKQWGLVDHKVFAYCNRSGVKTQKIHMTMPGFERVNLLK
jgi:hypothetical protein